MQPTVGVSSSRYKLGSEYTIPRPQHPIISVFNIHKTNHKFFSCFPYKFAYRSYTPATHTYTQSFFPPCKVGMLCYRQITASVTLELDYVNVDFARSLDCVEYGTPLDSAQASSDCFL